MNKRNYMQFENGTYVEGVLYCAQVLENGRRDRLLNCYNC